MDKDKVTLRDIYESVNALRDEIADNYVTKAEFWPVKAIVYGGAGVILISVLSALLYMLNLK